MEFVNMSQKRLECDQFTLVIGMMNLPERFLGEDIGNMDLTLIKERLINHALNVNNYIRQIWTWFDRSSVNENKSGFSQLITNFFSGSNNTTSRSNQDNYPKCNLVPISLENLKGGSETSSKHKTLFNKFKNLNRNEFFIYSASVNFNPDIKCVSDLLDPLIRGGIVFTITAKMPLDKIKRKFYLDILQRNLGKDSIVLEVKSEKNLSVDSIISSTNVVREELPVESSTVLKPVPKYFDEDYSDEEPNEAKFNEKPNAAGAYSFFRHSSHLLSKYATSRLVMREDDEFVTQRLLQVKLQRNQKYSK